MDSILLATYDYQGAGRLVGTHLPGPSVRNLRYDDTGSYDNHLDRFGRPIADRWTKHDLPDAPGETVDFYDVELGWDRNSNVTHAIHHVHPRKRRTSASGTRWTSSTG